MTSDEGAGDHIRNALAILRGNQELGETLDDADVSAVIARLRAALGIIERVNMPLPRRSNRGSVHRRNPALMVLGANPRITDADVATWAKLEYRRPDDPDGKDVIRVHEFTDGFEIGWLSDGSVQLSHPRHALWMDDKE